MNSNRAFVRNPGGGNILSIYIAARQSECNLKRFICKTRAGILAKIADPDQTPQNAASDQGLQCLFKLQKVKVEMKPS